MMQAPPKTIVIGKSSFIGRTLFEQYLATYPDTIGTIHRKGTQSEPVVDLLQPDLSDLNLKEQGYNQALICAGITDLVYCERNPKQSRLINVIGILKLVEQLLALNIKPIIFSSDIVFGGSKGEYYDDASPQPLNEYAKQKAELELEVPKICADDYLILRISKIYSVQNPDRTIIFEILSKLLANKTILAAEDLFFRPLLIDDLKRAILGLQSQNASGIFNLSGPDLTSWYNLSLQIAQLFELPTTKVVKKKIGSISTECNRPKRVDIVPKKFMELFPEFQFQTLEKSIEKIRTQHFNKVES